MRLYTWVLRLYPRSFRDRFAAGMSAAIDEDYGRARARGRFAGLRFLSVTVMLALWYGLAERFPRRSTVASFLSVDLRDAMRALRATPMVTAVAVLSLALGIGANTALFSILSSLVLRPLPVHEPDRLVLVGRTDWTNPIWEELRDRHPGLFAGVCAWSAQGFNLAESGRVDPVEGAYVSGSLFQTLGVNTYLGRPLLPADDVRGGGPDGQVAVIGYRLWQQRFGAMPDVLGRRLTINGISFRVVGVATRGFLGPEVGRVMDVFVPLASEASIRGAQSALNGRSSWWLQVMGRLKPDQTIEAAAAALNAARPAIREATMPPDYNAEYRASYLKDEITLVPGATGHSPLRNRFEEPLTMILGVVAAVLLIACANIANLMLARAAARRHELSVRLALGASRTRLGCQLLVESLLLAVLGGAAGLAIATSGATLLIRQLGSEIDPVALDVALDWPVLGFTAAVALGATLLFGLAPALGLSGVQPHDALKEQSRGVTGDRRLGLRNALVVTQVALSFALVAGAGLFVRTFATLITTPLGFNPAGLLIVSVDASRSSVKSENLVSLEQRIADVATTTPGISRASSSFLTPMSGRNWTHRVEVSGGPTLPRPEQVTWVNAVAPGWFDTYGIRLLAGRDVTPSDVAGGEQVAVVNQAFVRRFVGKTSPLGQRVTSTGLGKLKPCVIVGVVSDAIYRTARQGIVPTMYLPVAQAGPLGPAFSLTVKLTSDRSAVERGLTDAIARVDPSLAFSFRDYADQLRATVIQERIRAMLSGFFGGLAMLLAALGLYGVTSYSAGRRRAEIALRIALGANTTWVVALVLRRVLLLVACGIAIGVGLSVWAAGFVATLVFGVDARDPVTLVAAAVTLTAVGVFAGWLPARRASRLDPTTALRG